MPERGLNYILLCKYFSKSEEKKQYNKMYEKQMFVESFGYIWCWFLTIQDIFPPFLTKSFCSHEAVL